MPLYSYIDDRTGKTYDIIQGMNDVHEAFAEDGYKLARVWYKPQATIDTSIDCLNSREFVQKTGAKKGRLGDIQDLSRELSEKRAQKMGKDPLKEAYLSNWSKRRKGRLHPEVARQKAKQDADRAGFILED